MKLSELLAAVRSFVFPDFRRDVPVSSASPNSGAVVGTTVLIEQSDAAICFTDGRGRARRFERPRSISYVVMAEADGRLQVREGDEVGWISKRHAVCLDEALEHFTSRIRADSADVDAYLRRASARELLDDPEGAAADRREALRCAPDRAQARFRRARALHLALDHHGAVADYTEAIRLDPRFVDAYCSRAELIWAEGDQDGALADYADALRLDPGALDALLGRGAFRLARGEHDLALGDFGEAIRLAPEDPRGYQGRAQARSGLGDCDGALADYADALRLDPGALDAFLGRGALRLTRGEHDLALGDCDEAIRLAPKDPRGYLERAQARRGLGDSDGALADCAEALRLAPTEPGAHLVRAGVRCDLGDYERAIADCSKAVGIEPDNASALTHRSIYLAARGEFDRAIADAEAALRIDPSQRSALETRALALHSKGDAIAAERDARELARLAGVRLGERPDDARSHGQLGLALELLDEPAAAMAAYRRSLELDPDQDWVKLSLASLFADCADVSLRDPAAAVALARSVVERSRCVPLARAFLGRGLHRAGDLDGAVKELETAVAQLDCLLAESWLHLAMVRWKRDATERSRAVARAALAAAIEEMERFGRRDPCLLRLRAEAAALVR